VTAFVAEGSFGAASLAGIRQVVPKPVDFGRPILLIEEVAGTT
jgi:hypothetical protein